MKPPICAICYKRFNHTKEGGLISFVKRKSDIEWEEEMKREQKVGHPPWMAWFCGEHYKIAKKYSNLTISEAFEKLNEIFKR